MLPLSELRFLNSILRESNEVTAVFYSSFQDKTISEIKTGGFSEESIIATALSENPEIALNHTDSAKTQFALENLERLYGESASNYLSQMSQEQFVDFLRSYGVSDPKNIDALKVFAEGNLRHRAPISEEEIRQATLTLEKTGEPPSAEKIAHIIESDRKAVSDTISTSAPPPPPARADVDSYRNYSPTETDTKAIPTDIELGPSLVGILEDTLDPGDLERLKNATGDDYQLERTATEMFQLSGAEDIDSFNPNDILGRAVEIWNREGKQILQTFNPHATAAEIQAQEEGGIPSWMFALAAADLHPEGNYKSQLDELRYSSRKLATDVKQAWQQIKDQGLEAYVAFSLDPSIHPSDLEKSIQSDHPPIAFIQAITDHQLQVGDFLQELNQSVAGLQTDWSQQLTPKEQMNILLKYQQFSSQEELNAFIENGYHLNVLAGLQADQKSIADIAREAQSFTPSAQALWDLVLTDQDRLDLANKFGYNPSDISEKLPTDIGAALLSSGGDTTALRELNIKLSETSLSEAISDDKQFAIKVQQTVGQLSVAEQQTLLALSNSESLSLAVAAQLKQGVSTIQLQETLRNSSEYSLAILAIAPEKVQQNFFLFFEKESEPILKASQFVASHNNNLSLAAQSLATINSVSNQLSPAQKYAVLVDTFGYSHNQALSLVRSGDIQWIIEATQFGKNPQALRLDQASKRSQATGAWATMSPQERATELASRGLRADNFDLYIEQPPPEFILGYSLTTVRNQSLTTIELWKNLPVEKKVQFLKSQGLTDEQIQVELLSNSQLPSVGSAEFVDLCAKSEHNPTQLLGAIKPQILQNISQRDAQLISDVVSTQISTLQQSPDTQPDPETNTDAQSNAAVRKSSKRALSFSERQAGISYAIFTTLTPEQQKILLIRLGMDEKKVDRMLSGNLEPLETWIRAIISQQNDASAFLIIAEKIQSGELQWLSERLEKAWETQDVEVLAEILESMPEDERRLLAASLPQGSDLQHTLLAVSLQSLDQSMVSGTQHLDQKMLKEEISDEKNLKQQVVEAEVYSDWTDEAQRRRILNFLGIIDTQELNEKIKHQLEYIAELEEALQQDQTQLHKIELFLAKLEVSRRQQLINDWQQLVAAGDLQQDLLKRLLEFGRFSAVDMAGAELADQEQLLPEIFFCSRLASTIIIFKI